MKKYVRWCELCRNAKPAWDVRSFWEAIFERCALCVVSKLGRGMEIPKKSFFLVCLPTWYSFQIYLFSVTFFLILQKSQILDFTDDLVLNNHWFRYWKQKCKDRSRNKTYEIILKFQVKTCSDVYRTVVVDAAIKGSVEVCQKKRTK